ncbi:MAG: hypothetical protein ABIU07_00455 [Ramlibacter sp.]
MSDATYVSFVPAAKRAQLRESLTTEDTAPLVWREQRSFFGSEFYFSGPSALARRAQAYVAEWLITG